MVVSNSYNPSSNYNYYTYQYRPGFRGEKSNSGGLLSNPIQTVQQTVENTVDTLVSKVDKDKKKKSTKTAITVGSSVLVLSAAVALLNPKYATKTMAKLKSFSQTAKIKLDKSKDNFLASKFWDFCIKTSDVVSGGFQILNNANSAKDIGFMWLCCKKKNFSKIQNEGVRNFLEKTDDLIRPYTSAIHEWITEWFDKIGKRTVFSNYKKVNKKMDYLNELIEQYKDRLTPTELRQLESKIDGIKDLQKTFDANSVESRLIHQEHVMAGLEPATKTKVVDYLQQWKSSFKEGFTGGGKEFKQNIKDGTDFWAKDILQPQRDILEQEGLATVEKIVGEKGLYQDILDILAPKIDSNEKINLQKHINKAGKKLRKANHDEYVEYFDKKRDLILGGAPTDILTGVGLIGLSGIAIGRADTKEDKISKLLTAGMPAIAGVGTSIALTGMLFSGAQSMLLGSVAGAGISKLGSITDHYVRGKYDLVVDDNLAENNVKSKKKDKKENVSNA